ncbi:MAG: hypothetical protein WBZ36_08370 [Candidatus Nitrosopolaris sp.]
MKGAGTSSTNNRYEVVAAFFSPLESSSDGYQECFQIVIDNSNGLNVNLAEYMIEKIDLIRESYMDFDLLASDTINVWLAGNPAYILLKYSDPISGILEVMETGTIIRGKGYYIQYFAESAKYSNYLRLGHNPMFSFCQFLLIIWYKAILKVSNVLVKNDQIHLGIKLA